MTVERQGLRSSSVRRRNLSTVIGLLHLEGPMSRSHIGQRTGLTRATVATLVGDLAEFGFVTEVAPDPTGARGRPSPIVHPIADRNVVVAIDLMVDSIGVAIVGLGGTVLQAARRKRSRDHTTPSVSVEVAAEMVAELLELAGDVRLLGIGVAVPGLVLVESQQVALAPNLQWRNVDLAGLIAAATGIDRLIVVGNEADMGAVAENRRGSGQGRRNLLYLSGEVGVGGGVVLDGALVSGHQGFAGEIGHIPLNPDGRRCACGATGCFETELGEVALLRRVGVDRASGDSIDAAVALAENGDAEVLDAFAEHARWLALGLAGPLNLLDLDVVVCGGLFGRIWPFIEAPLNVALGERALIAERTTPVVASTLGDDASLVGAAELVWDRVLADPEAIVATV